MGGWRCGGGDIPVRYNRGSRDFGRWSLTRARLESWGNDGRVTMGGGRERGSENATRTGAARRRSGKRSLLLQYLTSKASRHTGADGRGNEEKKENPDDRARYGMEVGNGEKVGSGDDHAQSVQSLQVSMCRDETGC